MTRNLADLARWALDYLMMTLVAIAAICVAGVVFG
jgi:hypothetical protein